MWRGIACVFVVIFHTTLVFSTADRSGEDAPIGEALLRLTSHLNIGVPMFFVISGYCISATADAGRLRALPIRDYVFRRVRRIFPPYWAALIVQAILVLLIDVVLLPDLLATSSHPIGRPWTLSASQYFGNFTLTESWRWQFFGAPAGYILGQAWTLCYEEQFYLVTGACLFLARARFFSATIAVTALVLAVRSLGAARGWPIFGTFLDGHWLMFAAGIYVYWTRNYASREWPAYVLLAIGLVYAHVVPNFNLIVSLLFAMLLLALHRFDARWENIHGLAPLRAAGTICYSLYLVHGPIARAVSTYAFEAGVTGAWAALLGVLPVSLVLSCSLGAAFWWIVERRFLNPKRPDPRT